MYPKHGWLISPVQDSYLHLWSTQERKILLNIFYHRFLSMLFKPELLALAPYTGGFIWFQ